MKEKKHPSLHLFFWQAPSAPCTECFLPRHFLLNYPGPLGKKTLPNKLHFLQPFAAKRKRKQLEAMASFSKLPSRTEPRLNASSFPLHRSVSPFPVKHGYETHPETGKKLLFHSTDAGGTGMPLFLGRLRQNTARALRNFPNQVIPSYPRRTTPPLKTIVIRKRILPFRGERSQKSLPLLKGTEA